MLKLATVFLVLIWAGLCLGGNMIAAASKFSAQGVGVTTFLKIGKAQFAALGIAEWAFFAGVLVLSIWVKSPRFIILGLPALAFLVQQLAILPLLNERTNLIVAGQALPPSNMHSIYAILETFKIAALIFAAFVISLKYMQQPE